MADIKQGLLVMTAKPPAQKVGIYTIPNLLSLLRLIGTPICIVCVHLNQPRLFLIVMAAMVMSDWVDGKLAIWLKQQSTFGARLDSLADALMYATVLYGLWMLRWDVVREEAVWIAGALISYAVTSAAGLIKFGRWPSYHTRAAKTCWFLTGVAIIATFGDFSRWPLRIAMAGVILTNIEATGMTLVLPRWAADLPSIWHALRLRTKWQVAAAGDVDQHVQHPT